jgi:hypothetical protein
VSRGISPKDFILAGRGVSINLHPALTFCVAFTEPETAQLKRLEMKKEYATRITLQEDKRTDVLMCPNIEVC